MLKDFETYKLASQLYQLCEKIRCNRAIRDQLTRASLSIALNLAEGSAKPTQPDRRKFYYIALGSLRETQAILLLTGNDTAIELAHKLGGYLYRLCNSSRC